MRILLCALALVGCADGKSDVVDTDTDVGPAETDEGVDRDTAPDTGDTFTEPVDTDPPEWPDDPEDYPFDAATFLSSLGIPGVDRNGAPTCCRDWGAKSRDSIENGTSLPDNAIAKFNAQIGSFIDLQAELDQVIWAGSVTLLAEHHGLPASGDGAYDLALFLGEYAQTTTSTQAFAGDGTFYVWESSFVTGSGRPSTTFANATVTDDVVEAHGGSIDIPIPLFGAVLLVPAHDVTLTGTIDRVQGEVTVRDAELSAYVELDEFYDAYNELATTMCTCAGLTEPLFLRTAAGWESNCPDSDLVIDACGSNSVCAYVMGDSLFADTPGFCGFVAPLIPNLADLSLDRDPSDFEAFTVGLEIDGVPAEVLGVVPPPF